MWLWTHCKLPVYLPFRLAWGNILSRNALNVTCQLFDALQENCSVTLNTYLSASFPFIPAWFTPYTQCMAFKWLCIFRSPHWVYACIYLHIYISAAVHGVSPPWVPLCAAFVSSVCTICKKTENCREPSCPSDRLLTRLTPVQPIVAQLLAEP